MNRLLLLCSLLLPTLALANGHHHSYGGGSSSSHSSSSFDFEKEGACLVWAPADGGVDGGEAESAEAADAGHPGEICTEHARTFGCSSSAATPFILLAAIAMSRKKKS